jgi:hypothetical protein
MQKLSYIIVAIALLISGCASSSKLNKISVGMNKAQVIDIMGSPDHIAAGGSAEVFNYSLYNGFFSHLWWTGYNVYFSDGIVAKFGNQRNSSRYKPTSPSYNSVTPSYNSVTPSYNNTTPSNPSSGYTSSTGSTYEYDLSNPSDRVQYGADPAAQLRDRIDVNPQRRIEQNTGQYGGGVLNNNNDNSLQWNWVD